MPRRNCPQCTRPLPYAGRRCRHCAWTWGVGPAQPLPHVLLRRALRPLVLLVALLVVGLGVWNLERLSDWYASFAYRYLPGTPSRLAPAEREAGAWALCTRTVVKRLGSENAVETFPSRSEVQTTAMGDDTYQFEAYVEQSEEGGRRFRHHFTCTARYQEGKWTVEALQLAEMAREVTPGSVGRLVARNVR